VLDGRDAARGEDPVEDEVVDRGVQLVGALDLPLLQRRVHSGPSSILGFGFEAGERQIDLLAVFYPLAEAVAKSLLR